METLLEKAKVLEKNRRKKAEYSKGEIELAVAFISDEVGFNSILNLSGGNFIKSPYFWAFKVLKFAISKKLIKLEIL